MKKLLFCCMALSMASSALFAQKTPITITKRTVGAKSTTPIKPVEFKRFDISMAKDKGKQLKGTDLVKTLSGKSITVDEYLAKLNKVENQMSQKGQTLRNFKLETNDLKFKPMVVPDTKIAASNLTIKARSMALPASHTKTKAAIINNKHISSSTKMVNLSKLKVAPKIDLGDKIKKPAIAPETGELVYDIAKLIKPLTDKLKETIDTEDANFELSNASLTVNSFAEAPVSIGGQMLASNIENTNSEYKVSVNFNAAVKGSFGLPVTLTIPLATMNGEFIARSNKDQKLSRKVVVSLMGRSLFNKTSVVNTDNLFEEDQEELDLNELMDFPGLSSGNFLENIPTIGFNLELNSLGSVGCMYSVDMWKGGVDAYIGPTYSTRLRVAASFGYEDIFDGGVEGIITLARGGLGFGGHAGIDLVDNKWKLINKAYVESTLELLEGEINFFTRYPDVLGEWKCGGPCIKKETVSLFKLPAALKLNAKLVEEDKSRVLAW